MAPLHCDSEKPRNNSKVLINITDPTLKSKACLKCLYLTDDSAVSVPSVAV